VKVLLSSFLCAPNKGSELGNGWYWANSLADHGHEVTVLALSNFREEVLAAGRTDIDFRFIDMPKSPLPSFAGSARFFDLYGRWQDAALRCAQETSKKYDVVHHVVFGSLHLGSSLWRMRAPLVYGPIGGGQTAPANYRRYFGRNWPAEVLRTAGTGSLLKLIRRSRDTIRRSAVVLATNSATEAVCRRLGASDVRYFLAEGLPSDWLGTPHTRPAGIPTVLWVGRMLPRKAPVLAVEAFAELRRSTPARLVMVGDGPLREQVRAAIDRLGIAEDVQLLGQIEWTDIRPQYDSASVFLFSSLRDSSGSQFLEALGRGLPAVALDHHGIGDLKVGPATIKVALTANPVDLPARLGNALQTILTEREWESRSAAGISWATEHLWSAKAAAATQIYQEVVQRNG
jgi:glycosyltransferase involved in cell wall biosynthesis